MSDYPPVLNEISQYLAAATELDQGDECSRCAGYYCRLYFAKRAGEIIKANGMNDSQSIQYVTEQSNLIMQLKNVIKGVETEAGKALFKKYITREKSEIDALDASGSDYPTVLKKNIFLSDLFTVLEYIEPGNSAYTVMKKRCKLRAVEIGKALRANQPVPPNKSITQNSMRSSKAPSFAPMGAPDFSAPSFAPLPPQGGMPSFAPSAPSGPSDFGPFGASGPSGPSDFGMPPQGGMPSFAPSAPSGPSDFGATPFGMPSFAPSAPSAPSGPSGPSDFGATPFGMPPASASSMPLPPGVPRSSFEEYHEPASPAIPPRGNFGSAAPFGAPSLPDYNSPPFQNPSPAIPPRSNFGAPSLPDYNSPPFQNPGSSLPSQPSHPNDLMGYDPTQSSIPLAPSKPEASNPLPPAQKPTDLYTPIPSMNVPNYKKEYNHIDWYEGNKIQNLLNTYYGFINEIKGSNVKLAKSMYEALINGCKTNPNYAGYCSKFEQEMNAL